MRKALIIGFQYSDDKKLPGIATDLYQVYTFLKKHNWQENEICVMTDIEKDETTDILKTSIIEKVVDSGVLSFIEDCKEREQYVLFTSHYHYNNFSSIFSEVGKSNDDRSSRTFNLFIYYTGHCKEGNIILPNNSLINLPDYFSSKNIFTIIDCCEGGLDLPFVLNGDIYRCKENPVFFKDKIICISSSKDDEKSITTQSGSLFSRHIFDFLDESSNLSLILQKINKLPFKQTGNISASFPSLYIPGFFYSYPSLDICVYGSHIVVRK